MTDNEIIKALECCIDSSHFGDCFELGCPMASADGCDSYEDNKLLKSALDLINRQKAEIERLEEDNEALNSAVDSALDIVNSNYQIGRTAGIKEFWEKLNHLIKTHDLIRGVDRVIDDIAKEMIGEEK